MEDKCFVAVFALRDDADEASASDVLVRRLQTAQLICMTSACQDLFQFDAAPARRADFDFGYFAPLPLAELHELTRKQGKGIGRLQFIIPPKFAYSIAAAAPAPAAAATTAAVGDASDDAASGARRQYFSCVCNIDVYYDGEGNVKLISLNYGDIVVFDGQRSGADSSSVGVGQVASSALAAAPPPSHALHENQSILPIFNESSDTLNPQLSVFEDHLNDCMKKEFV